MYTHYNLYILEDHRQPRFRMNKKNYNRRKPKTKNQKKKNNKIIYK